MTRGLGGIWPGSADFQLWMGGEEKRLVIIGGMGGSDDSDRSGGAGTKDIRPKPQAGGRRAEFWGNSRAMGNFAKNSEKY